MDSIDITDSAFSLDVPDINEVITTGGGISSDMKDYTMFIYIGAAILVVIIGMFIYKFYQNKKNKEVQFDCEGGFCTMAQKPPISQI